MHVLVNGKLADSFGNVWQVLNILGEEEMVEDIKTFYENIVALCRTDLASISRQDFYEVLGASYEKATTDNELLQILKKVHLFRGLSRERLKFLVEVLTIEEFQQGQTIFDQNTLGQGFFIIKQGKVDVIKDGVLLRSVTKHDYFGERSLLFNELRSATIKAQDFVQCWVLKNFDFLRIIDERIRAILYKRIRLQDESITLSDLLIVKKIGQGMLGNVFLMTHKKTKEFYALKTIDRRKIENQKIKDSIMLERKILMQLDHGFIVKLIKTFKDQNRIYFLLEYVRGEDLFDVIRQIGLLSDEESKFYASCLLIIIEHLHEREIAYRDFKPENIMTDEDGYLKLIDFGTSKIVTGRTYTIVGTPHYMAPEVILGKGYNINADY